jgi:Uncharacterised nucleotidyltransferase
MSSKIEFQLLDFLSLRDKAANPAEALLSFNESEWQRGLKMADTAGLTFHLLERLRNRGSFSSLPARIQDRLQTNEQDHTARVAAMCCEFLEFNRQLRSQSIRYLALKGLTYFPDFVDRIEHRVQYDHDFLIAQPDLERAFQLFQQLGYTPLETSDKLPVDHLPTLIRKTGWRWKGNLYDPEIPRAVELHFRLWDETFDLIEIQFAEDVWSRAIHQKFQGECIPTLCPEDALLYGVLHAFRHLLRNDLRLSHLYELAYFLHTHPEDYLPPCQGETRGAYFWEGFPRTLHTHGKGPQVTATVFRLAAHCFNSRMAPAAQRMIRHHLSPAAELWIQHFGRIESVDCFRKSKSAVLLHLDFLDSDAAKLKLMWRKLFPRRLPLPSFGVQTPQDQQGFGFHLKRHFRYGLQILKRFLFHTSHLSRFLIEFPIWQCRLYFHRSSHAAARHHDG